MKSVSLSPVLLQFPTNYGSTALRTDSAAVSKQIPRILPECW